MGNMCGILCVIGRGFAKTSFLKHRGPDASRVVEHGNVTMVFNRLAINDTSDEGMQPFKRGDKMLMCNGEIYNHKKFHVNKISKSDCEVLLPLIEEYGFFSAVKQISGEFAMCMTDGDQVLAARDHMGIRPMFFTKYDGGMALASEAKALLAYDSPIHIFPPGHVYDSLNDQFACWYPCFWNPPFEKSFNPIDLKLTFIKAVKDRMENSDLPVGFLLSGGLDSSLVCAIAAKFSKGPIRTFSIGTKDSPDVKAARIVADHLKSNHTEILFDIEEGIQRLSDVIWSLESYDTTTVRASVPMWLLARYISQNTDIKVLLSGEGSDEIFGGYLYFHDAPSPTHFASENTRRLKLIHQFDGLRADRCIAAHGLELRVPFLDKNVIEMGMRIDPRMKAPKNGIEKWVLRDAFDEGYLPNDILWRQKNGMSDAVGYSWVTEVKKHAESVITDEQFETLRCQAEDHNVPLTKEEALYRLTFWRHFGHDDDHLISEIWRPKWTTETDPSATRLKQFIQ
jgi:asparagine synthase (glutamine-hydrolysing)